MKLSLDWINDYVKIEDIEPQELAERITMATAEVEEVIRLERRLKGVVAGEVISKHRIMDSGPLFDVVVDCGEKQVRTITTAKNVRVKSKVAFAGLGAVLNHQQYVQLKEIAGAESYGKLCTAEDLCLGPYDDSVFYLPDQTPTGTPLAQLIPETDYLLDIDNKSLTHRPDLWGHYGIAREIAAIYQRELRPLKRYDLSPYQSLDPVRVLIEDENKCERYGCITLENLIDQPTPPLIQSRLYAVDQRSLNLIVDLTNYVMLELGQPMHAFDGNKVHSIRVGPCKQSIEMITLDGTKARLEPEDLLIWDQNDNPVAIAGVIGEINSAITPETTSILLESANFFGSSVRRTSRRLALFTEAGKRFEKQQPKANTIPAIERFCFLLSQVQPEFTVKSSLTRAGDIEDKPRFVKTTINFIQKRMGISIAYKDIKNVLESLAFNLVEEKGDVLIEVPHFRGEKDITIQEDVLEEISRIYGYDRIQPIMPLIAMKPGEVDPVIRLEGKAREYFSNNRSYLEVQTYNWYDEAFLRRIGYNPKTNLTLLNPSGPDTAILRENLLPNLLQVAHDNFDHSEEKNIYEIGKVFKENDEDCHLSGLCYGRRINRNKEEFYLNAKGELENFLVMLGYQVDFEVQHQSTHLIPWETPSYLELKIKDRLIGKLGILPELILQKTLKSGIGIWFELDLDTLSSIKSSSPLYKPESKYPGSSFDFSLLYPVSARFAEIEQQLSQFQSRLLTDRKYLYKYQGKEIPENMICYTFRYQVAADDRTLSGEELESFHHQLTHFMQQQNIHIR